MNIVFLDVKTIGEDIDLSGYDQLGEVVKYPFTTSEEVPGRVEDADVMIVNKIQVNESTIGKARNLKLVCVTATGTNNLDKDYLKAAISHGGMLPDIQQNPSRSTPLQCCFSFLRNFGTMMIM